MIAPWLQASIRAHSACRLQSCCCEPGAPLLYLTHVMGLQAVRNGPGVMPGAVAVEDELGRVISLATFTPEVGPAGVHTVTAEGCGWSALFSSICMVAPVCA